MGDRHKYLQLFPLSLSSLFCLLLLLLLSSQVRLFYFSHSASNKKPCASPSIRISEQIDLCTDKLSEWVRRLTHQNTFRSTKTKNTGAQSEYETMAEGNVAVDDMKHCYENLILIDAGANLTNKKYSRDLDAVIQRAQDSGKSHTVSCRTYTHFSILRSQLGLGSNLSSSWIMRSVHERSRNECYIFIVHIVQLAKNRRRQQMCSWITISYNAFEEKLPSRWRARALQVIFSGLRQRRSTGNRRRTYWLDWLKWRKCFNKLLTQIYLCPRRYSEADGAGHICKIE